MTFLRFDIFAAVRLQIPFFVVEGANLPGPKPPCDTVGVKTVGARARHDVTILYVRFLVGLAIDANVHGVVSADGAVFCDQVPRPETNSCELFYFEIRLGCSARSFAFIDVLR